MSEVSHKDIVKMFLALDSAIEIIREYTNKDNESVFSQALDDLTEVYNILERI